jgi:two-component system sensor kinase FixL
MEIDATLPAVHGDPVSCSRCCSISSSTRARRWPTRNARRDSLLIRAAFAEPGEVAISVVDGGPGIAPERLDKIFEPFVSSKPLGIGLGLVISRSIVTAHGGRLWCRNNETRGATFTFTIPCEPTPAAADVPADRSLATGLVAVKGALT